MATAATSRIVQDTLPQPTLSLAFALGENTWQLGCTIGVAQQPRARTIPAGDVDRVQQEIARAKQRCGQPRSRARRARPRAGPRRIRAAPLLGGA
jgi:hypothetical protein